MPKFFSGRPEKIGYAIGMTQYMVGNFLSPDCPDLIWTYDISSCVIVMIKNLNDDKKCSYFGVVHLNLANVFFEDKGKENLRLFIDDFQSIGGDFSKASIQILGGMEEDPNDVRGKVRSLLCAIGEEKGISNLVIKMPSGYMVSKETKDCFRTRNGQIMAVAFDRNGSYIRKITVENGRIAKREFYPSECPLLQDENLPMLSKVDAAEERRLRGKTNSFLNEINRVHKAFFDGLGLKIATVDESVLKIAYTKIKSDYCAIEKCVYSEKSELKAIKGVAL